MRVIFAGIEFAVLATAYHLGYAAWYKLLLPSGLAWVRAEECEVK